MTFLFVSHASPDKKTRVRPIVEALAHFDVPMWLDRPGPGLSHFGFDSDFIRDKRIRGLRAGRDYTEQISLALSEASAVLCCLSRAILDERVILEQELVIADQLDKLVVCIVDDLPHGALPDVGLRDLRKLQADRIDPDAVRAALDWLDASPDRTPAAMPHTHRETWEVIKKLLADIEAVARRSGGWPPREEMLEACRARLRRSGIGPMVHAREVPQNLIHAFASGLPDPREAFALLSLAMELRAQVNKEGFEAEQILVDESEITPPTSLSSRELWAEILILAGQKSRRTLAALLVAPGSPGAAFENYLQWLEEPSE